MKLDVLGDSCFEIFDYLCTAISILFWDTRLPPQTAVLQNVNYYLLTALLETFFKIFLPNSLPPWIRFSAILADSCNTSTPGFLFFLFQSVLNISKCAWNKSSSKLDVSISLWWLSSNLDFKAYSQIAKGITLMVNENKPFSHLKADLCDNTSHEYGRGWRLSRYLSVQVYVTFGRTWQTPQTPLDQQKDSWGTMRDFNSWADLETYLDAHLAQLVPIGEDLTNKSRT